MSPTIQKRSLQTISEHTLKKQRKNTMYNIAKPTQNVTSTHTVQNTINESISTIKKAKDVKKIMNDIINVNTHALMVNIKALFNDCKAKEAYSHFNNKSIALLILHDEKINHSKDTKMLLEIMANGLTVHIDLKFTTLKFAYNQFKIGKISKNNFNNMEKLLKKISEIKAETRLTNAKKIVNESNGVIEVELLESK